MSTAAEPHASTEQQFHTRSSMARIGEFAGRLRAWLVDSLVIGFILAAIALLAIELFKTSIVIEPISVPEEYKNSGYTPEVISGQLTIKIQDIYRRAYSGRSGSRFLEIYKQPDIQLPEAGVSMRSLVTYIRSTLGIAQTGISGAIVRDNSKRLELLLQVSRLGNPSIQISQSVGDSVNNTLDNVADSIVKLLDRRSYVLYMQAGNTPDRMTEMNRLVMSLDWRKEELGRYCLTAGHSWIDRVLRLLFAIHDHLRKNDTNPDAWDCYFAGALAADEGDDNRASLLYKAAHQLDQNVVDALGDRATLLRDVGMQGASISLLETAIITAPSNPMLRLNLATSLMAAKKYDAAEKELIMAMDLDPDFLLAKASYADYLYNIGKIDEGKKNYAELAMQYPRNYEIWLYWGNSLFALGRTKSAVAKYRHARELSASSEDVLLALAFGLALEENIEARTEAASIFSIARRRYPRSWRVLNTWGEGLLYGGEYQTAERKFLLGLKLAPHNRLLTINYVKSLCEQEKYEDAAKRIEKALDKSRSISEDVPITHETWADCLSFQGDLPAAIAEYRTASLLAPDDASIRVKMDYAIDQLTRARVAQND